MEAETVGPKAAHGDLLNKEARLELGLEGQWGRQRRDSSVAGR